MLHGRARIWNFVLSVQLDISRERAANGKGKDHSSTELVSCFATRGVLRVMFGRLETLYIGSPRGGQEIVALQVLTAESLPLRTYLCQNLQLRHRTLHSRIVHLHGIESGYMRPIHCINFDFPDDNALSFGKVTYDYDRPRNSRTRGQ